MPRSYWRFALVWMGNYLGYRNDFGPFRNIVNRSAVPAEPALSRQELRDILAYYETHAPVEVQIPSTPSVTTGSPRFRPHPLPLPLHEAASVTLVHVDEGAERLYVGTGSPCQILPTDKPTSSRSRTWRPLRLPSEPVSLRTDGDALYVTTMGHYDRDAHEGAVHRHALRAGRIAAGPALVSGHHRTSDTGFADLDGDGGLDILMSGFGDFDQGQLTLFLSARGGKFVARPLHIGPGVLNTITNDIDGDGDLDVYALTAQARQALWLFRNDGARFQASLLWERPPGWGYNQLLAEDFDGDGRTDLLTLTGNNMEIEDPPLRPQHGLRFHRRTKDDTGGTLVFDEAIFVPLQGAMKAVAKDLDGDGDVDVAAIAHFPDWSLPRPPTFVWLENQGAFSFAVHAPDIPAGRWLSIDVGDLDGDGDQDVVLGNSRSLSGVPSQFRPTWAGKLAESPLVMWLENLQIATH